MDGYVITKDMQIKYRKRPWTPKPKPYEGHQSDKFYNTRAWHKTRYAYRKRHPMCKMCEDKGITKLAEMVDHITPIKDGGDPLDWNNLQSLCNKCHRRKTLRETKAK